ncbi:GNAT family N-acetyltransferase [Alteromonas lipolytica]|uniref:BioF2-like acetyltransferase domain-containing protein n=1 Tax=Alteromonas lipolytica TaxID=1856405 RepID=A0A1E8FER2_9ALTE|nr:GNAT family N-acetyltransferase [Alteromonas lipolytica]OFI34078.1 hypothetical protein BFC17_21250 [Alteromonas lipolytica]GGF65614.1 hypothetical protein GCM10011338_17460 [Alteromonas lipolytica]
MTTIQVSVETLDDIDSLKSDWSALFARSNKAPFLNWNWINSYFHNLKDHRCLFLAARQGSELVGAGILVFVSVGLKKFAYLNRFGDELLDQPWIEYNDFLIQKEDERRIRLALIDYCVEHLNWHEFVVGASIKEALAPYQLFELEQKTNWYSHTYQTRLNEFLSGKDYLASLSRNTRYQINRSIREYEKYGPIRFNIAASVLEALAWFEEAAPHHIARWKNTDVGSGFTNPVFVSFHRRFIQQAFEVNELDFIKVTAGSKVISYLYNFKEKDTVYFYLSANVYDQSLAHTKPGLVSHYLAISHYIDEGKACYDFMGGESQYKRSLANQCSPILINNFKRRTLKAKFEEKLRFIKHQIKYKKRETETYLAERQLIITGGVLNPASKPQYNNALAVKLDVDSSGPLRELNRLTYQPGTATQAPDTNITFKSGHISGNTLWLTTETEILEVGVDSMTVKNCYSDKCFNDLHHVIEHNNSLFIADTGLDCVMQMSLKSKQLTPLPVVVNACTRQNLPEDLRAVPSTKPHLAHPNYCFTLGDEVWVTRCDYMDAVCVNNPQRRIFIGDGLVHDGVVKGKYIYFTTVNGRIKVFDKKTLQLCTDIDLAIVAPHWKGWFRGITPITSEQVLIAMSKPRASKRQLSGSQESTLLLVDIFSNEVLQHWNLGDLGFDAVFSVLEVPKA